MNLNIASDNLMINSYNISTWFVGGIIIFLLLSLIIIGIITLWKGKIFALLQALVIGILGIGIFSLVKHFLPITESQINNAKTWLSLPGKIFIDLMTMIIPLYIFSMIVILFLEGEHNKINKRTYMMSFISLLGVSLFGIVVALCMIPLIMLIPNSLTFDFGESTSINWLIRNWCAW